MGVEEEFFIVDPATGNLAADGLPNMAELLAGNGQSFAAEFQVATVESRTGVCGSLGQVRAELLALRGTLVRAAADAGLAVAAAGLLPTADWRTARIVRKPRYDQCLDQYRDVVRRRITCGCHVHVGVPDRELAVQVLNRVQPWLPVFLALSASSPFYEGADTGYHAFRSMLWGGFPAAGPPPVCASHREYREQIRLLLDSGAIVDEGNLYWDARLGLRHDTVEFRVADACSTVDETVLQAGLARALVLTCVNDIQSERRPPSVPPALLRAAMWRAGRSGLDGDLIDAVTGERLPAARLLRRLVDHVREALKDLGDWAEVTDLLDLAQRAGTSSRRQLETFAATGRMTDVVDVTILGRS
ncbi:carboxylate-amine ligase [Acrocarpospora catenulata]|uniref:carboxylate-amine ligase n=1 Tax=Acrocarpospora catenulata TaxID=2836182 RepID=UPI002023A36E|nr:glutamate--cysteine ligase [Acrocarpospora catenulata]